MRVVIAIVAVAMGGCSLAGGDDGDDGGDSGAIDAAPACTFPARECAFRCEGPSEGDCCNGTCTSCPGPNDPPPDVGDTCSRSDWEHDFSCEFMAPEMDWLCCGYSPTGGTLCTGACSNDVGGLCCEGASNPPLTCVDGRWQ
jgi:hypothetical protein